MEFDLFNNPHPLIFYQHGKPDGEVDCCSRCRQPWRPPAFGCSDCNFHLHQSCIDLPPQIHTPFHPHHKRPLSLSNNNDSCNCCGQMPCGDVYRCSKCGFQIDVQCAIADTKASGLRRTAGGEFRHFSHPHPLTLRQEQQWGNGKVVCLVCQVHIKSGPTYFCSYCDSHFHQQCAELPREILNLDYHDHSLFLFARPFVYNTLCDCCRNECVEFFYGCPLCNFNLHVACFPSFKHEHAFVNLRKVLSYNCQVCGKSEHGIPYICSVCFLFAHRKCVELPLILLTSEHHHHLTLTFPLNRLDLTNNICKICREEINISCAGYVCWQCKYIAHVDCAENVRIERSEDEKQDIESMRTEAIDSLVSANNDINREEDTENQENGILHFSHKHKLTLRPSEDNKHCDGCMRCITTQSYGCPQCGFYLHEEWARLPRYKNFFLHLHLLSMVYIPDFVFSCAVCLQYCHGFAYHCENCHYTIDIRCAAITIPFTHTSHRHPLSLYNGKGKQKCEACWEGVENKVVFRCVHCYFHLDARCANLPLAVRNRFYEHPLSLTFENEDELEGDEYYCDICEEERKAEQWFYYCRLCCFAAHLGCVLGEYPFLKSAECEGHRHSLNLVKEGKKGYSACGACGDSCDDKAAFECGRRCKLNVHAFGPCYHQQITHGRISFTVPSLRHRSIPLYSDSIQRKGSKSISLDGTEAEGGSHSGLQNMARMEAEDQCSPTLSSRPRGGPGGHKWDDGVFSTIRRIWVFHGRCINSIQIEYHDKDGNSIWSLRHGGNEGQKSEVVLRYPDEYLISIYGYYGNVYDESGNPTIVIRSLTLGTNKKTWGPFGVEDGIKFSFPTSGAKIVGLHGRSGWFLDSIELHFVPMAL